MSSRSKTIILGISILLAVSLALTGCGAAPTINPTTGSPEATPSPTPAETAPETQQSAAPAPVTRLVDIEGNEILANKMTVSASGVKKVMPDVAYITLGTTTQNKSMSKAQSRNREIMNALIEALKAAGLKDGDIETVNYSVYPTYDYTSGTGKISGYEVSNMIRLTIKDIDKVGDYIDVAAANGANENYSINFDLENAAPYYNEALADAMTKAKGKADAIAQAGGYQITGTLEITESQARYSPDYREYAPASAADEAAPTPVSAGLLEITANVTVIYRID
jgi:uncharacterized protein YggE